MAAHDESIIYLEHDAEITEAITKLKQAESAVVRIVVPPRSPLLQSVVNLKLLKKGASAKKKKLVLVTSDKSASALAAKVGIPVAKNVKSEAILAEVTPEPKPHKLVATDISPLAIDANDQKMDQSEELPVQRFDEPIQDRKKTKKAKSTKDSSRGKVPNYNKFQKWIWVGLSAVGLIFLMWLLSAFTQTVTVNIQAIADRRDVNTQFSLVSTGGSTDTVVVAKTLEMSKDLSQSVEATGEKDVGSQANGSVALKNCEDTSTHNLPVGSKISTAGKIFTTSAATTLPEGEFSGGGTVCKSKSVTVSVVAVENGDTYNFSNANFTVVGMSSRISGVGTTSGGVSKKVRVVAQTDVDTTIRTLVEGAKAEVLTDLKNKSNDSEKVFDDTLVASVVTQSTNPPVGTEATNVTISVKAKYTILAAAETDLARIIENSLEAELKGGSKVLNPGLDQAKFVAQGQTKTGFSYALSTVAYIGQPIDSAALQHAIAGKAKKEVADIVKQQPNVTGVTVDGWPLVPNMPIPVSNIKVKISVTK